MTAPGKAKDAMPGLDEPIERARCVRDSGQLDPVLPAFPQSAPDSERRPAGLAVDQHQFPVRGCGDQMRGGVERQDQLCLARPQHTRAERCRRTGEVERVEVRDAQRHRAVAPVFRRRRAGHGRPRQNAGQHQNELPAWSDEAPGQVENPLRRCGPDACGRLKSRGPCGATTPNSAR